MNPSIATPFDKVLLQKAKVIERCVARAQEEHRNAQGAFLTDYSRQDAAILNVQRACEAALDLAQHVIARQGWGVAETSKDLFRTLHHQGVIDAQMSATLVRMVGFRNMAVHAYENIDMTVVESIIIHESTDLLVFSALMLQRFFAHSPDQYGT